MQPQMLLKDKMNLLLLLLPFAPSIALSAHC
jgi:hypothetical protein